MPLPSSSVLSMPLPHLVLRVLILRPTCTIREWALFPPSPEHHRPPRRAPPSKWARTSGPGESSRSRSEPPQSPPHPSHDAASPQLSPASRIRRPIFHCDPIPGNSNCRAKEIHLDFYYDLPALAADPGLRDSMRLVHRYSLESFTTSRQYFYPRVVIEFYHTMTSRGVATPTAIHFSIDGRPGILRATNIAATFDLSVVLANSVDYRQWPHPSPRDMVRLLSRDISAGSILFRRQLPPSMLLIDHILRCNLFPLQHHVHRRGAILEALYRISEGF